MKNAEVARKDDVPPVVQDMEDAGLGFEENSQNEQITPFLRLLQGLSPQINPRKAEYVQGAALGQILNTGTGEVFDGEAGIDGIFCYKSYHYGMWIPRDLGGGFRGMLRPDDQLVVDTLARMDEKYGHGSGRFNMPRYRDGRWTAVPPQHPDSREEVELVETAQLYGLFARPGELTSEGDAFRAIIAFTSTSFPVYQSWNSRHSGWLWPRKPTPDDPRTKAPAHIFYYKWHLTAVGVKNAKGEFMNWRIERHHPERSYREAGYMDQDPALYGMARDFFDLVRGGSVKVDQEAGADEEIPL